MKKDRYKLLAKQPLDREGYLWRLWIEAPEVEADPGQFVNIEVAGKYLRRPISVSEYSEGVLSLIVRIAGEGTAKIVATAVGGSLDMLTGLGNRFTLPSHTGEGCVLLIGGGVGYAPLVGLMKMIRRQSDFEAFAVFGFNRGEDVPLDHIEELREEGFEVEYCTMTGDMGDRGNALEVAREHIEFGPLHPVYFYTCGPMPMMKAVCGAFPFDGQLSLEARMGCGFGACMGCSIMTADGPKRICREGPVFSKSSLLL